MIESMFVSISAGMPAFGATPFWNQKAGTSGSVLYSAYASINTRVPTTKSMNLSPSMSAKMTPSRPWRAALFYALRNESELRVNDAQQFALAAGGGVHQHHHVVVAVDNGVPVPGREVDLFRRRQKTPPTTLWS